MTDTSILVNGQHWDWRKIDPAEFQAWYALEQDRLRLERELGRVRRLQDDCVFRTRRKYDKDDPDE